eukprot:366360_1
MGCESSTPKQEETQNEALLRTINALQNKLTVHELKQQYDEANANIHQRYEGQINRYAQEHATETAQIHTEFLKVTSSVQEIAVKQIQIIEHRDEELICCMDEKKKEDKKVDVECNDEMKKAKLIYNKEINSVNVEHITMKCQINNVVKERIQQDKAAVIEYETVLTQAWNEYKQQFKPIKRTNHPNNKSISEFKSQLIQTTSSDEINNNSFLKLSEPNEKHVIEDKKYCEFVINVQFNEQTVAYGYKTDYMSFYLLQQFISKHFNINVYMLKYMDEKKKQSDINSNPDLMAAVEYAQSSDQKQLNVVVVEQIAPDLPLHRFSVEDICNKLKLWIYDDINYKKHALKTKNVFVNRGLNGSKMEILSADNVKDIIKEKMLTFMTCNTLDIMIEYFSKWKNKDTKSVKSKSAEQIADILYEHPFNTLLKRINEERIDGQKMIVALQDQTENLIEIETGWNEKEIKQIQLLFHKHKTLTKQQCIEKINNTFNIGDNDYSHYTTPIPHTISAKMLEVILSDEFDIGMLYYNMRNNKDIQSFSDKIINMVYTFPENNDQYDNDDLIKRIYTIIAKCFSFSDEDSDVSVDWICHNCGNDNFCQVVSGKFILNLENCRLCGITQVDSIMMKIRKHETFLMVNDVKIIDDQHPNNIEYSNINTLIEKIINNKNLDLICLNKNDNKPCDSILRLGRVLIMYNNWLKLINDETCNIDDTIDVNVSSYVDNNVLRNVFIENANLISQIRDIDMKTLVEIFDGNIEGISDINIFEHMKRKTFISIVKKNTKIKPAAAGKLYRNVQNSLKRQAQQHQFGKFLTELNFNSVEYDYNHLIQSHINHGNKNSIKNVFRFFNIAIHYEDTRIDIENCISLHRHRNRIKHRNLQIENEIHRHNKENDAENIDIWALKQHYYQSQLDIIQM